MSESTATKQETAPMSRKVLNHWRTTQRPPATKSEFEPGNLEPRKLYRRRRYIRARINVLGRQYIKLRNDLLAAEHSDWKKLCWQRDYALRGKEFLVVARQELLSSRPRVYLCSSLLYFAEGNLAWLYRPGILMRRCETAMNQLQELKGQGDKDAEWLLDNLQKTYKMLLNDLPRSGQMEMERSRWLRSALADTIEYFSQQDQEILMNDDLQVARLRSLFWYVGVGLSLLVLAAPYITISLGKGIPGWPVVRFGEDWLTQVIAALAVSAVGAVGGIFSGLVSTRDSSTTLDEYRTSMLKLGLKPLVGAIASITLYLLLSWQVLTGVKVTNGGTYLLVGFLAGFSERYFLRLLHASPEDSDKQKPRQNQLISAMSAGSVPSSNEDLKILFDTKPDEDLVPADEAEPSK